MRTRKTRVLWKRIEPTFSEKEERAICGKKSATSVTLERNAKELMDVLRGVDVLIDIHATIRPSVPFVYQRGHRASRNCRVF